MLCIIMVVMEEQDLLSRRQVAESAFNELLKQEEQKQTELENIRTEKARYQGEYRLINDLLAEMAPVTGKKLKKKTKAEVIDVTNVVGA